MATKITFSVTELKMLYYVSSTILNCRFSNTEKSALRNARIKIKKALAEMEKNE